MLQTCPGLEDWLVSPAAIQTAARRCLASVARDPRHDTTPEAVLDLDQVRKALGYHQINLYGVSYGVTLGLAYLQRYSSHVRAAVLDSGSLLNVPEEQLDSAHAQHAFDQLAARCAATPACARSYHPAADLTAILARLTAHPAQVTLPGPGGQHMTLTVTAAMVPGLVDVELSSIQTAVLQGPSVFAANVTIKAAGFRALCAVWPHDPGVSGTVRSTVPIVFLNGADDPGDPPASVAGATATMPNALLVSVPNTGHWTLGWNPHPGCLLAATAAFIQAGQPAKPAAWDACTRAPASEPMPFPTP